VRRRHRRRVAWRVITGRRVLVVPVAVAVGWELEKDGHVVVVHEVRSPSVIVIRYPDGRSEEVECAREDTPENGAELQGTVVAEGDPSPYREVDEEVEE